MKRMGGQWQRGLVSGATWKAPISLSFSAAGRPWS